MFRTLYESLVGGPGFIAHKLGKVLGPHVHPEA